MIAQVHRLRCRGVSEHPGDIRIPHVAINHKGRKATPSDEPVNKGCRNKRLSHAAFVAVDEVNAHNSVGISTALEPVRSFPICAGGFGAGAWTAAVRCLLLFLYT